MLPHDQLTQHVLDMCRRHGFDRVGVAGVEPSRYERELREWLDAGKKGTMAWLGENLHVRSRPARLLAGARAIVMVAAQYAARGHTDAPTPAGRGRVARYARGKDYHRVLKKRLHAICDQLRADFPGCECRAFADIEPMPERELAARAGLGWVGKHTLVIDPQRGSWMVLGGFATTLALVPPPEQPPARDHCGTCTRCIDACPTTCITPYSVDASRCISYLTIERRAPIDPALHDAIGDWAFGCDVCQEVCPHNSPRPAGVIPPESAAASGEIAGQRATLDLLGVLGWTMSDRTAALPASVIKRATLDTLKRNAVIVLGNQIARRWDDAAASRLRDIARDESIAPMVRDTARQVMERLDRANTRTSP